MRFIAGLAERPIVVLPIAALVGNASCDLFHDTNWQNACERDPAACEDGGAGAQAGGASEANGSGGDGAATSGPGSGAASSSGPGSGGGCPSAIEDCATPGDDDCDGNANEGCALILYLAFDEGSGATAQDSSGNGHHGSHDAMYVQGKKGSALEFDGVSMVTVAAAPSFTWGAANADFTVVYWLRLLAPPPGQWRGLFHKGNTDCGPGDRTSAHFLAPAEQTLHSTLSTTYVDPIGNCNQEVINTQPLPVGTWVHVASVKEASTHRMYLDGALAGEASVQPVIANQAPLYLGKDPWYVGTIGNLDEVQVYARALSAAEIAVLAE